jgi:pyrroloquinoline-quinone synthase
VDFWDRLDAVADRWNVLRHPFYLRWSEGTLTRSELACYAGQYAHAVDALAAAARDVARRSPSASNERHAAEEEAHVSLWSDFREAVGSTPAAPLRETAECARAWADPDRSELRTLVALYAIESAQPAISETKRTGLVERYGFEPGPATRYFDVHTVLDVEHAGAAQEAIAEARERTASPDRAAEDDVLVAEAERVLSANWRLLDGVDRVSAEAR